LLEAEQILQVDERRSLTVTRAEDGATLVLAVEDPHTVAIVELTPTEADWLLHRLAEALDAL